MTGRPLSRLGIEILDGDGVHVADAETVGEDLVGARIVHMYLADAFITRHQYAFADEFQIVADLCKIERCTVGAHDEHRLITEGSFRSSVGALQGCSTCAWRRVNSALCLFARRGRGDRWDRGDPLEDELLRPDAQAPQRPDPSRLRGRPERGKVRDTLAYVRSDEALWFPIILMAVLYTLSFNFSVTMPLLAERTFGGSVATYGTLLSFYGLGSFLGALGMARVRNPNPRRLAWAAVAFGVTQGFLAVAPTLAAAHVLVVVFGIVSMAFMITGNTGLQLAARPDMRGRVMAMYAIIFLGGTPIGAPITGAIAEHFGPREAVAFGAVAAVLAGAFALRALASQRVVAPAA